MANWWDNLDDDTKQALIVSGAGAASGYFGQRSEDARHDEDRADSAITNRAEGIRSVLNSETGDYQYGKDRGANDAVSAARMSGNSPLQFQSQRAQMSALGDILKGSGDTSFQGMPSNFSKHMPTGATSTPFSASTMNYFSPSAMANSEQQYWAAQQNIDPRLKSPDLAAAGYGDAGAGVTHNLEAERDQRRETRQKEDDAYQTTASQRREAMLAALNDLGPEGGDDKDKKGGGVNWGTVAKVGAGVGAGYLGAKYA